jgi:hypothetical protein
MLSYNLQEPGTITMKESAVAYFANMTGDNTQVKIKTGSQTAVTSFYTKVNTSVAKTQFSFVNRFDSDSTSGAGFTLSRGANLHRINITPTTADAYGSGGFVVLNYTSGKSSGGVSTHNHSVNYLRSSTQSQYSQTVSGPLVPIPEPLYWLNGAFAKSYLRSGVSAAGSVGLTMVTTARPLDDPRSFDTSQRLGTVISHNAFGEAMLFELNMPLQNLRQFPQSQEGVDAAHHKVITKILSKDQTTTIRSVSIWSTYHTIKYSFDLEVTGYTGSGEGINFSLVRPNHEAYTDLHSDTFTGTNGNDLAAPWVITGTTGYSAKYLDNACELKVGSGLFTFVYLDSSVTASGSADFDVACTVEYTSLNEGLFTVNGGYQSYANRWSTGSYMYLYNYTDNLEISLFFGGVNVSTYTLERPNEAIGDRFNVRMQRLGAVTRGKVWPEGDPEPHWQVAYYETHIVVAADISASYINYAMSFESYHGSGESILVDNYVLRTPSAIRHGSDTVLLTGTTTSGGVASGYYYDDTVDLYMTAHQGTKAGASTKETL